MVLYRHGDMLYKGVRSLVMENLDALARDQILPAFPTGTTDVTVQNNEEEVLLKALTDVWDDHRSNMTRLGQILKYMVSVISWILYVRLHLIYSRTGRIRKLQTFRARRRWASNFSSNILSNLR
jgi:hypothetical protein